MPRHTRILLSLLAGIAAGVSVNLGFRGHPWLESWVRLFFEPVGRMWLNALIMVVIPLILATLSTGVAGLGSVRRVGRVGLLTLACFLTLTVVSTGVGLLSMNVLRPGAGLDPATTAQLLETYRGATQQVAGLGSAPGIDTLVRIIPRNPVQAAANGDMLGVIFFSLMLGIGMAAIPKERAEPLHRVLESLGQVMVAIIDLIMAVAPIGVFCLVFSVTSRFGLDLVASLLRYVAVVLGGLIFVFVAVYSTALVTLARRRPLEFLRLIRLVLVTAFSTSSSNATLPTTIRVATEQLGVRREVASFVLPLGATLNMNGTSLFEGATVLFLAQVFGVQLDLQAQLLVVWMAVLTAIGTAGIPGASIPLLMMVLAMVGVPVEAIAIIIGIDRLLDMCRTVLNVTGDLVTAAVVDRFEPREPAPG